MSKKKETEPTKVQIEYCTKYVKKKPANTDNAVYVRCSCWFLCDWDFNQKVR